MRTGLGLGSHGWTRAMLPCALLALTVVTPAQEERTIPIEGTGRGVRERGEPKAALDFDIRAVQRSGAASSATTAGVRVRLEGAMGSRVAVEWGRNGLPASVRFFGGLPFGAAGGRRAAIRQDAAGLLGAMGLDGRVAASFLSREAGGDGDEDRAVSLRQEFSGIPVYEGRMDLLYSREGALVMANLGDVVTAPDVDTVARVSASDAVSAALRGIGVRAEKVERMAEGESGPILRYRNPTGGSAQAITGDLVILAVRPDEPRLAWRLYVDDNGGAYYEILIDAADGRLLMRHNLVRYAGSARIWKRNPLDKDRVMVTMPDSWLAKGEATTKGNNVDAYLDTDGNNVPDTKTDLTLRGGRAFSETQAFDFPSTEGSRNADPRLSPAAAVTSIFYFMNLAHDFFYELGFDERSWNFQSNNGTKGGQGNDAVVAEAHDRAVENNANMATPAEGRPPRMQAGIFTYDTALTTDDRDAALDGEVMIHEYAHGVTNRMVGRGTDMACLIGAQSRAMGEGWSDYFSIRFFSLSITGTYLSKSDRGIRRSSYAANTMVYSDLGSGLRGYQEHDDGEFWGAVLWDLRTAVGAKIADKLVVEALRITPCRPSMVQARDAILATDTALNRGANLRALWAVFAKRGLGASACGYDGDRGLGLNGWSGTIHLASTDLPADGGAGPGIPTGSGCGTGAIPAGSNQEGYQYRIPFAPAGASYRLKSGPNGMAVGNDGVVRWTPGIQGRRFQVEITESGGRVSTFTGYIPVLTRLTAGKATAMAGDANEAGIFLFDVPAGTILRQVKIRGGTGDADLAVLNPQGLFMAESAHTATNNETVALSKPVAGTWIAVVDGYRAFQQAQLTLDAEEPSFVAPERAVTKLTEVTGGQLHFRTIVPAGTQSLSVKVTGATGSPWVILRRGQPAFCRWGFFLFIRNGRFVFEEGYTCTGNAFGVNPLAGEVQTANPAADEWYITVVGLSNFSNASLTVQLTMAKPALIVSSPRLEYSSREGGAAMTQVLTVTQSTGPAVAWRIATQPSAIPWLTLTPANGSGVTDVRVVANPARLAAGVYEGKLIVSADGVDGSPKEVALRLAVTAPARFRVSQTSLSFRGVVGSNPEGQTLDLSNAGSEALQWTASVSTRSGGNWLSVSPSSGSERGTLAVAIRSASLPPGRYEGAITLSAPLALAPAVIPVTLDQSAPVTIQSVQHGATLAAVDRVAPGTRIYLNGRDLAAACGTAGTPACLVSVAPPHPYQAGDTEVLFNGEASEILSASPTRLEVAVPIGVVGPSVNIVVRRNSGSSSPFRVGFSAQLPGIFSTFGPGLNGERMAGWITGEDGSAVGRERALVAGELATVRATGLGGIENDLSVSRPLKVLVDNVEAEVAGQSYSGGLQGGIYEVNFYVPANLARKYPTVRLAGDGGSSNVVTAGGPTIRSISPARLVAGENATVVVTGVNLPSSGWLWIGEERVSAAGTASGRTLVAEIEGTRLRQPGVVLLRVSDAEAAEEEASNAVSVTVAAGGGQ